MNIFIARPQWVKPSGVEARIFQEKSVTIAADALAPSTTRQTAAMALTMEDKQVFLFHMEGIQVPVMFLWQ